MPFNRPTLQELDDRIRNDITGHVRMTGTNRAAALLRRSVVAIKSRVYSGACNLLYAFLVWLATQRFVHSMEAEFLEAEGLTYKLPRKGADTARGKATIPGVDGTQIAAGQELRHDTGVAYRVTTTAAIAAGVAVLSLEAVDEGTAGNLAKGEILRLAQPIKGITGDAVVDADGIVGGVEVEDLELYRERILERKRKPPHGGNKDDYEMWAKEVKGVTRAWCLPLWNGLGTVGVMFLRDAQDDADDKYDPFPNKEQCKEVWEYIEKVRPVTASEIHVFAPEKRSIDITVKLSPDNEDVRAAVMIELEDFLYRDGAPGEPLRVSRISEAISTAVGEHHHYLEMPFNDILVRKNEIPVLGEVVFLEST